MISRWTGGAHDWYKRVTRAKSEEYLRIFSHFTNLLVLRKLIKIIAFIWRKNILGNLSLDIICYSKLIGFPRAKPLQHCSLFGTGNVCR